MNAGRTPDRQAASGGDQFLSTRWSIVLAAGNASQPDSQEALSELCRIYWYPLYAYVRRRTNSVHEAQDLIQEFFLRLLERNTIAVADQQRGRFRTFLLTSLRNFLANEWAKLAPKSAAVAAASGSSTSARRKRASPLNRRTR